MPLDASIVWRVSADNGFTEFYTEVLPQWGIEKLFELNDRNFITVGYFGGCHRPTA